MAGMMKAAACAQLLAYATALRSVDSLYGGQHTDGHGRALQSSAIIKWYGGSNSSGISHIPINVACAQLPADGRLSENIRDPYVNDNAIPLHLVSPRPREFWVLGLQHVDLGPEQTQYLSSEVMMSADGGDTWRCRGNGQDAVLQRIGSTSFSLPPGDSGNSEFRTLCIAGGRSFLRLAGAGPASVGEAESSVHCTIDGINWWAAASLPTRTVGASHTLIPVAGRPGAWHHVLAGGWRDDNSDDLWLGVMSDKAPVPYLQPVAWRRVRLSSAIMQRSRPVMTWLVIGNKLLIAGGIISLNAGDLNKDPAQRVLGDEGRSGADSRAERGLRADNETASGSATPSPSATITALPTNTPWPLPDDSRLVDVDTGGTIDGYALVDMLLLDLAGALEAGAAPDQPAGSGQWVLNGTGGPEVVVPVQRLVTRLPEARTLLRGHAYTVMSRPTSPAIASDILIMQAEWRVYSGLIGPNSNGQMQPRRHISYRGRETVHNAQYEQLAPAWMFAVPAWDDGVFPHWVSLSPTGQLHRASMQECKPPACDLNTFGNPCAASPYDAQCRNCTNCAVGATFPERACRPINIGQGFLGNDATCMLCLRCPEGSVTLLRCGMPGNPSRTTDMCALEDPDGVSVNSARAPVVSVAQATVTGTAMAVITVGAALLVLLTLPVVTQRRLAAAAAAAHATVFVSLGPAMGSGKHLQQQQQHDGGGKGGAGGSFTFVDGGAGGGGSGGSGRGTAIEGAHTPHHAASAPAAGDASGPLPAPAAAGGASAHSIVSFSSGGPGLTRRGVVLEALFEAGGPVVRLWTSAASLTLFAALSGSLLARDLAAAEAVRSGALGRGLDPYDTEEEVDAAARVFMVPLLRALKQDELLTAAVVVAVLSAVPLVNLAVVLLCDRVLPSLHLGRALLHAFRPQAARQMLQGQQPLGAGKASPQQLEPGCSASAAAIAALWGLLIAGFWRPRLLLDGVQTVPLLRASGSSGGGGSGGASPSSSVSRVVDDPEESTGGSPTSAAAAASLSSHAARRVVLRWMTLASAALLEAPLLVCGLVLLMFGRDVTARSGSGAPMLQASVVCSGAAFALQLWHCYDTLAALTSSKAAAAAGAGRQQLLSAPPQTGGGYGGYGQRGGAVPTGGFDGGGAPVLGLPPMGMRYAHGPAMAGGAPGGMMGAGGPGDGHLYWPGPHQHQQLDLVQDYVQQQQRYGFVPVPLQQQQQPDGSGGRAEYEGGQPGDAQLGGPVQAQSVATNPVQGRWPPPQQLQQLGAPAPQRHGASPAPPAGGVGDASLVLINELWTRAATPEARRLAGMRTFFRRNPHLLAEAVAAVQQVPLPVIWRQLLSTIEAQVERSFDSMPGAPAMPPFALPDAERPARARAPRRSGSSDEESSHTSGGGTPPGASGGVLGGGGAVEEVEEGGGARRSAFRPLQRPQRQQVEPVDPAR